MREIHQQICRNYSSEFIALDKIKLLHICRKQQIWGSNDGNQERSAQAEPINNNLNAVTHIGTCATYVQEGQPRIAAGT